MPRLPGASSRRIHGPISFCSMTIFPSATTRFERNDHDHPDRSFCFFFNLDSDAHIESTSRNGCRPASRVLYRVRFSELSRMKNKKTCFFFSRRTTTMNPLGYHKKNMHGDPQNSADMTSYHASQWTALRRSGRPQLKLWMCPQTPAGDIPS